MTTWTTYDQHDYDKLWQHGSYDNYVTAYDNYDNMIACNRDNMFQRHEQHDNMNSKIWST
jgi:hypothetical protein